MSKTRRWVEESPPPPVDLRLVPAALALWCGVLLGLLAGGIAWWFAVFAAAAIAAIAALGLARIAWPAVGGCWRSGAAAALAFLAVGAVVAGLRTGELAADPLGLGAERGSWATLTVSVGGFPVAVDSGFSAPDSGKAAAAIDESRWRVPVDVQVAQVAGESWSSRSAITVYGQGQEWSELIPGEVLEISGRLGLQEFAATSRIVVHSRDPPTSVTPGPWWSRLAWVVRAILSENAARLDGDAAGLLPGLVVGDTSAISEQLSADAKATGIAHLLAVSGSHFAILCGMVIVVLRRAGPRLAALGGFSTLVALVVLVGPQPSVLRAAVMGGIAMLALLSGRTRSSVPALAAAVIALLLVDPSLAVNAGFALSVLATGGLVLIAPSWSESLQRRGFPRGWAELIAIPVAAQIVTMPVIVTISGSISVVGVLANILVAPVVAPALVIGVLCAVCGPWWPGAAGVFADLTEPLLSWVAGVAHTLARWPNATVDWPATPIGALLLAFVTAVLVILLRFRRFREMFAAVAAGLVIVLVPTRVLAPGWPVAGWLLTACEVGQGDAMVLSTGDVGTAVVIDTGPDPGLMDACLDRLGVGTIALLILTHLHADHVDGLIGAMDGRTVGAIAVGPGRLPVPAWETVRGEALEKGVTIVEVRPGMHWASGELNLQVLAPAKEFTGTDSDPNNDSLVVIAERNGERMLMTGDIEIEAQQALLNSAANLDADILKVPHHGSSKLLDAFVRAVSPSVAVIGVGAGNDYGHPNPKALDLLARDGVRTILRTDEQGDVSVGVTDGVLTGASRGPSIRSN